jgi:vacuolar-type H+-ATPase subunit F/Vma7
MTASPYSQLAYVGPAGAGMGFNLAGITVQTCDEVAQLVPALRKLKESTQYGIIFVDEGLAEPVLADVERLNADTLPAIVLLPNPTKPANLAQVKLNNLMIKAVGTDIFNT